MTFIDSDTARRAEVERLIDRAKSMLTEPAEEIAAIYLDHALDALQAIPTEVSSETHRVAS